MAAPSNYLKIVELSLSEIFVILCQVTIIARQVGGQCWCTRGTSSPTPSSTSSMFLLMKLILGDMSSGSSSSFPLDFFFLSLLDPTPSSFLLFFFSLSFSVSALSFSRASFFSATTLSGVDLSGIGRALHSSGVYFDLGLGDDLKNPLPSLPTLYGRPFFEFHRFTTVIEVDDSIACSNLWHVIHCWVLWSLVERQESS